MLRKALWTQMMKATLQEGCVRLMAVTPKYDILELRFVISGAFAAL